MDGPAMFLEFQKEFVQYGTYSNGSIDFVSLRLLALM